jgi:hypothetical protein
MVISSLEQNGQYRAWRAQDKVRGFDGRDNSTGKNVKDG